MRRPLIVSLALILLFGILSRASDPPSIIQPADAGFTPVEEQAWTDAMARLERHLMHHELGSQKRLGEDGWGALQFAAYTAGSLERLGYTTVIVRANASGTAVPRVWLLVLLPVGTQEHWVPVEPLMNPAQPQRNLGAVPHTVLASGDIRYDAAYMVYDETVDLPPNQPPNAVIEQPIEEPVEGAMTAWFGHRSRDPDGEIVLYRWTFAGEEESFTPHLSVWHTFPTSGTYLVTLTVIDSRGAQATTQLSIYVMTEEEAAAQKCTRCGGG